MSRFDLTEQELHRHRSSVGVPDDFDAFWTATLDDSREVDAVLARTPLDGPLSLVRVWDISFAGFAGDPVRAWLVVPRHIEAPMPAVIEYVGYGRGRGRAHERLHWPVSGYAQLIVDTRGQGSSSGTGGSTPDPHGSAPAAPGYLTRGIESPETYYYRRVFTDAVRAVDAMRSFPEIDPERIAVSGNSQGGAIAIAAAALSDGVAAAMPTLPVLCDLPRVIGLTDAEPHAEIVRYLSVHRDRAARVFDTLAYFDGANLARRATAPALFGAALMDMIAPPSGVFAAANAWAGPATVETYAWNGHEGGEGIHWELQAQWLARTLAPGGGS